MKKPALTKFFAFILSHLGFCSLQEIHAASLSVVINPSISAAADSAYPGADSIVTSTIDHQTGLNVSVAGRNYGADPTPGRPRWGLRRGAVPGNPARSGFLLTNGFTPAAAGATADRNGNDASYLTIRVGNVQPGTVFQNVSINLDGLVFTRATNAWGASSEGGFQNWSVALQTNTGANGRQVSVELPDFTFSGAGGPLEFRLYGVTGADEGAIATIRLSADFTTGTVPEPSTALLALTSLAGLLRRKRRASV